ncbi:DUF1127 domain-containing protein [Microvirga guangxiensis]|uniref:YjiS-like domain-containing protein n=1 Tax=Microvirga guangxiensis TaxID=549386 RepID=A0A1G5HTT8_9HYPH|nr:DUF1127 domain-containing protein [Microvirga guangxiensis]SCY67157.1 protein of unknown function [Microvirga guangxiensis]
MMQNTASLSTSELAHYSRLVRAVARSAVKSARYFVVLTRRAATRERTHQQLTQLDARLLEDVGLEPFDVYYGWRGSSR